MALRQLAAKAGMIAGLGGGAALGTVAYCADDKDKYFDPEALERGAKALREIQSSPFAKKVWTLAKVAPSLPCNAMWLGCICAPCAALCFNPTFSQSKTKEDSEHKAMASLAGWFGCQLRSLGPRPPPASCLCPWTELQSPQPFR